MSVPEGGQPHGDTRYPLRGGELPLELSHPVLQKLQVGVVLVVSLPQLHRQELLVSLQLGDDALGVVVLALQLLNLGLIEEEKDRYGL